MWSPQRALLPMDPVFVATIYSMVLLILGIAYNIRKKYTRICGVRTLYRCLGEFRSWPFSWISNEDTYTYIRCQTRNADSVCRGRCPEPVSAELSLEVGSKERTVRELIDYVYLLRETGYPVPKDRSSLDACGFRNESFQNFPSILFCPMMIERMLSILCRNHVITSRGCQRYV